MEFCLSVIITCYNYERFVGRAIESVLRQRAPGCELLVVDDGSRDGSWSVIQSYGLSAAFRVENGGAARAGLHALRHTRAPFVLFLDADDELAPGSLAEITSRLDGSVSKLQFALLPIDEDGCVLGPARPRLASFRDRHRLRAEVLAAGTYTSPPTSGNVFRRDVCDLLEEVDYEMSIDGVTLFAAPFFGDVVSIDKPLGFYRLHGQNYSQAGSRPTAHRFATEADRFVARHHHLGRILARRGVSTPLPAFGSLFFYRERRLYQTILEGQRPRICELLALLRNLLLAHQPVAARFALALFLTGLFLLPPHHRPLALDWRFQQRRNGRVGLPRARSTVQDPAGPA